VNYQGIEVFRSRFKVKSDRFKVKPVHLHSKKYRKQVIPVHLNPNSFRVKVI